MGAAEQVRAFYAALDAGDAEGAAALLADAATDDRGERGPVRGAAAVVAARLESIAAPEASWTVEALIARGDRVATQCTVSCQDPVDGQLLVERESEWLTVGDDGLIVEIRSYRGADEDDDGPVIREEDLDWSLLETGDELP